MNPNTRTITESDALDALAVAFEQVGDVDLQMFRRLKAAQRSQSEKPLTGEALEAACKDARTAAHEALQRMCPEASPDEIMGAISAVVDAPPPSMLASQAVDLSGLMGNVPPPTFLPSPSLGDDYFYEYVAAIIAGHKKSGKSWAMTVQAADMIRAGRHVVYVDHENGDEIFAERLEELPVSKTQVSEHFHYVPFPRELPALAELRAEFERLAETWPDCWVVLDSMRSLMSRYGLDPNKDTDVEKLLGPIMAAVKDRPAESRIGVTILDHSNRSTKDGDAYAAAGSFAKAAGVDVVYFFEKVEGFSVHREGLVKITAVDDRRGRLDECRHYKVGGQGAGKPIKFVRASNDEVGAIGKIRTAVEVFLTDQPKMSFTITDIKRDVKGNDAMIAKAVELVVRANPNSIFKQANPARKDSWVYCCDPDRNRDGGMEL